MKKQIERRMRPLLGTFVEVTIAANGQNMDHQFNEVFYVIERMQRLLSFHDCESDLTKLNLSRGQWITLNPLSIAALRIARRMTEVTNGLFNFTFGGQLVQDKVLPNHNFIKNFLPVGAADDLQIKGKKAKLRRPVLITLDGIAKGLAVDLAIKKMKSLGIAYGSVNAGGDLRVFGNAHAIPISRRDANGKIELLGSFANTAMATSLGADKDQQRFPGHILSTHQRKFTDGIWTVKAPAAWLADALTKVACNSEPDHAARSVIQFGGELI